MRYDGMVWVGWGIGRVVLEEFGIGVGVIWLYRAWDMRPWKDAICLNVFIARGLDEV